MPFVRDPERLMRNQCMFFCILGNFKSSHNIANVESEPIHKLHEVIGLMNFEDPPPSFKTQKQPAPEAINPDGKSDTCTSIYLVHFIAQNVSWEYETSSYQTLQETMEHTL